MKPKMLTYDGTTQSITEWALDYGITPNTIHWRLSKNWTVSRAITTPMRAKPGDKLKGKYLDAATGEPSGQAQVAKKRRASDIYLTFDGKERSLSEWAQVTGIKHATLRYRLKQGWSGERILTEPVSFNSRTRPGVVLDFGASQGTGVGRSAQDSPNISFSERKAS